MSVRLALPRCAVVILWATAFFSAAAADVPNPNPKDVLRSPLAGKVDTRLIPYVESLRQKKSTSAALTHEAFQRHAHSLPGGASASRLPLILDVPRLDQAALQQIAATGAQVLRSSQKWDSVSVLASVGEIDALSSLAGVRTIKLTHRGLPRQNGASDTQADISIRANQIRSVAGLSGAGIKIGVISDSINQADEGPGTTTGTQPNATVSGLKSQASGDLPPSIQMVDAGPPISLQNPAGSDEGAAMMEEIYDIAPGVSLAFASYGPDQTTYATSIQELAAAGCKIIVDDFGDPSEPFFQDGPISQAIQANQKAGILHFSAAGNDADRGVLAVHTPVNPGATRDDPLAVPPSGNFFHDWGVNTGGFLPIDFPAGADWIVVLQWNQPFQSMKLGPGASVNLDLYLFDGPSTTSNIVMSSVDPQYPNDANGNPQPGGDPIEMIEYQNKTNATQRLYLAVDNAKGSLANNVMRVLFLKAVSPDPNIAFPSAGVNQMTAYGHSAIDESVSVGAIFYVDIDSKGGFGPDTTAINAESSSSKGGIGSAGVPYYFDATGNPLPNAPVLRDAPALAAPDGSHTSFFGTPFTTTINGVQYDSTNFPSFFGTSAAAPVAAAVAALLLERSPKSTPAQVKICLQKSAIDIVASAPPSGVGPDDRTGYGLIDAVNALAALPAITSQPADVTINEGQNATFTITATGLGLSYRWQKNGVDIPGPTSAQLTLTNEPATDSGSGYVCIVTNAFGSVLSRTAILTVLTPPRITQQPQSVIANLGASVTFSVTAVNSPLSYQWKRNGQPIPGATQASYTFGPTTIADDGAVFTCVVTNPFGSATSAGATLTINTNPAIVSGPTATPSQAAVGTPIQFSVSAAGARGQPVTISWDFGDGTGATGPIVTHPFPGAQVYNVTMTAADPMGATSTATLSVFIYLDANNDGIPDFNPTGDEESFVDTYAFVNHLQAQDLAITKMSITLNFAKDGKDTLSISGTLPVPANFAPLNQNVFVVVGGMVRQLALTAKAIGVAKPNGIFTLKYKKLKKPADQFGKFTFTLKKGSLKTQLASSGLVSKTVKNESDQVKVTIFYNGAMYQKSQSQLYTAQVGKMGRTK